jgi:hypothetical protein
MSQITEFQEEQFHTVCERMAEGETLSAICKDGDLPSRTTFLRWVRNDDSRKRAYQLARQAQADFYFDQIKDLAFDGARDTITNDRGSAVCDHEWIGRSRLKVDSLKWLASKLDPIKFGDRMPEVVAAKQLDVDEQKQIADTRQIRRIERHVVQPGDVTMVNGVWVDNPKGDAHLRARIAELEAELAGQREPKTKPPALLEHDPGLPRRLDSEIAKKMVALVRGYTLRDQRPPEAILDECYTVIRNALSIHFGPTGEPMEILATA